MNQFGCIIRVGNQRGIHGRVATRLAEIAREYKVTLCLSQGGETADCSSILDVLGMALVHDSEILLTAVGHQGEAALQAAILMLTSQNDP